LPAEQIMSSLIAVQAGANIRAVASPSRATHAGELVSCPGCFAPTTGDLCDRCRIPAGRP